jgi:DNA-binding PadR family transcriptional regulator
MRRRADFCREYDERFKYIAIYRDSPMSAPDRFTGSFHFMAKGDFKGLVLTLLRDRPMHGYELIKALEERWHGVYKPSAGAIYPALRRLLSKGYVSVNGEERRKTYRITREGQAYLRSRRKEIEQRFRAFEKMIGPERAAFIREFRATGKLLRTNIRDVTTEQAKELKQLMADMREKVLRILSK